MSPLVVNSGVTIRRSTIIIYRVVKSERAPYSTREVCDWSRESGFVSLSQRYRLTRVSTRSKCTRSGGSCIVSTPRASPCITTQGPFFFQWKQRARYVDLYGFKTTHPSHVSTPRPVHFIQRRRYSSLLSFFLAEKKTTKTAEIPLAWETGAL